MFDRMIRYAARLDPHAVAAIAGTAHVSYAELDHSIDCMAALLHAQFGQGEASKPIVGIAVGDVYLDLLLSLGCARVGLASTSLPPGLPHALAERCGVTAVISDDPAANPALLTDAAWSRAAFAQRDPVVPVVTIDPDAIGRLQFSSGTTGTPKASVLSWALIDRRIEHTVASAGPGQRFMSLIAPYGGSLQIYLLVWIRNGCVLFGDVRPAVLARQLPALRPNLILASPVQIKVLVDAMPDGAPPLPDCVVSLAGARCEPGLRERIALRMGSRVRTVYGSSEGGVAAMAFATPDTVPGAAGYLTPWTAAQVVDADGVPLAAGEVGRIRFRGRDVVSGYVGDPPFEDGWFEPGDLGSIDAQGLLIVLGRIDDVMNLGGRKIAPEQIEDAVRAVPGVVDVAAFSLADAGGVETAWLAIVRGDDYSEEAIAAVLPRDIGTVRLTNIDHIPRTPLGKPQRERLRESAARLADGQ